MQAKLILSARLFSPAHYVKSWRIYSFTMFSVLIREIFFLMVHFWLIICLYNLGLLAGQKRPENNLWLWWSGHYFNINIQITGNSYNFSQHFSKAALQNQVSYCVPPAMAIWLPLSSSWTALDTPGLSVDIGDEKRAAGSLLGISFPRMRSQI